MSRRAIAASTGLPRETVRRRIGALLERGVLIETHSGVRIQDHLLEDPINFEFFEAMAREFTRTGASLSLFQGTGPSATPPSPSSN